MIYHHSALRILNCYNNHIFHTIKIKALKPSKNVGKDQETIQSRNTSDLGYHTSDKDFFLMFIVNRYCVRL